MPDLANRLLILLGTPKDNDPDWPLVYRTLGDLRGILVGLHCRRYNSGWMVGAIDQLLIGVTIEELADKFQPRRGIITDYPIFSALAAQAKDKSYYLVLRRLQALYLLAAGDRQLQVVDKRYRSPLASAGRACRRVANGKLADGRIRAAVLAASGPEVLCDSLEQIVKGAVEFASQDDATVVRELLPLLRDVRDGRMPRYMSPGGSRNVSSRYNVQTLTDISVYGGRVRHHRLIEDPITAEHAAELSSEGLAGTNEITRASLYVASPPTRSTEYPADGLTDYQANHRLVLRARGFKSGQQPVPNRTDTLHDPALLALIQLGHDWRLQDPVNPDQEAEQMLAAMLLFGCEAEDLAELGIWSSREELPKTGMAAGIVGLNKEIVIPVANLPDGWVPLSGYIMDFRENYTSVHLPIPLFLPIGSGLLSYAMSRVGQSSLFEQREDWDRKTDGVLNRLNARYSIELTRPRVAKYLWSAIYQLDGDMAEATMLSYGRRESNDPRLYYYAPERDHLARQYMRAWRKVAKAVNVNADTEEQPQSQKGYVGSAAVPVLLPIQAIILFIRDYLVDEMCYPGRRCTWQWVKIHNAYTVYVVRQIQWLTGIRAVRDPIELDLYDPRTGFLGVIDKDSDDQYGARVVWLIEPVQEQISRYLRHVEAANKALYGHAERDIKFKFIDYPTLEVQPINQRNLVEHSLGYVFSPNAHRHYMRTRLRELGVDAGYVDAWMGHGGIGREPYARHSALTPSMMREAVRPALMTIWEELRWEVVPSQ